MSIFSVFTLLGGLAFFIFGMNLMSHSLEKIAGKRMETIINKMTQNRLLGLLMGCIITIAIQSSSAVTVMLVGLVNSGLMDIGNTVGVIMGSNIGTCATAILSSIGVSRNAKRVAVIHLSFNLIGTAFFMTLYFILHAALDFAFVDQSITPVGIALCHSVFNIATTVLLLPFSKQLVAIASNTIKTEPAPKIAYLDERLFATPSVAVSECNKLSAEMADLAKESVEKATGMLLHYTEAEEKAVAELENTVDVYEDHLGSYLVKLSGRALTARDNRCVSKILHTIGNFERISDHARNLAESSRETAEKQLTLSESAKAELQTLQNAVLEIVKLTTDAYETMDTALAERVEPLEQVIDLLVETIRLHHTDRLQSGECTIEKGFVLADILNNYERISDHCSNIAVAVLESSSDAYDPHEYLRQIKTMDNPRFRNLFTGYKEKYLA